MTDSTVTEFDKHGLMRDPTSAAKSAQAAVDKVLDTLRLRNAEQAEQLQKMNQQVEAQRQMRHDASPWHKPTEGINPCRDLPAPGLIIDMRIPAILYERFRAVLPADYKVLGLFVEDVVPWHSWARVAVPSWNFPTREAELVQLSYHHAELRPLARSASIPLTVPEARR